MPNRLAEETSPYLLQHKENPVDWFPWGEEALAKARAEDKPIFLSIGYSACHWCHVMEHESFENPQLADLLNQGFVPIKVDREERPDLDQIYMNAVQMLTGRGGWPMSVFLTPELKPFYGGTYWPPTASRGMPGFDQVLAAVRDAWSDRRDQALATAEQLTQEIQSLAVPDRGEMPPDETLLGNALRRLEQDFDPQHGGFGAAPKFPHAMCIQALLRYAHRTGRQAWLDMATTSLDKMHAGGIYDHLGGGFARYSVDERWLVPHFEKMLYDNAQLSSAYLEAFLATGQQRYADVVRETLDYVLRDMTDPRGAFYSAEDADSEGEEGKFYVWSSEEVRAALGEEDADLLCRVYDVTPLGNFEGKNILNLPKTLAQQAALIGVDEGELRGRLARLRAKLLENRSQRARPARDEKVLVNWNALMIGAMSAAGATLGEPRYVEAAQRAAEFIRMQMSPEPGRLLHVWCADKATLAGYLDDYSALANALITLYETTFDAGYLEQADTLLRSVMERFWDPEKRVFYYTASDHEALITRPVELTDNATASGASLAVTAMQRLGALAGDEELLEAAAAVLETSAPMIARVPMAMGQMLLALDWQIGPSPQLVFSGDQHAKRLAESVHRRYLPRKTAAYLSPDSPNNLRGPLAGNAGSTGEPTLNVCHQGGCQPPVVGETAILEALAGMSK